MNEKTSRIPRFYEKTLQQRLGLLEKGGFISAEEHKFLLARQGGLPFNVANEMVENAIGVLELPLGTALNFLINEKEYVIPMAIEEPSVIAAVSHIAKIVRQYDGFKAQSSDPIMIGQIQVVGVPNSSQAIQNIENAKEELLTMANACDPKLISLGGGARAIETRWLEGDDHRPMLILHLLVDCRDAMGANLINTMTEKLAQRVEDLTGGSVYLRILSNLADRRLAKATCRIPFEGLGWRSFSGKEVAEGVQIASEFATADPYRAATHNKGIMNGISAVCIAVGNDWRAIEAGAHSYAARSGKYGPLATWHVEGDYLIGEIELPMAVGIVGGTLRVHPTVQTNINILNISSADELGEVMATVGLAQNLAALKALSTEGIQRGHMSLHARSVALSAGASEVEIDEVVDAMIDCGEVRADRAETILLSLRSDKNEK